MRSLFVGLAATALMVLGNVDPALAFQGAAKADTAKQKAEAATLAPLVIQNAKLACATTDVRTVQSTAKQVVLELACQEGIGYIVASAKDGSGAQARECIPPLQAPADGLACSLPANVPPAKGLQPYLTRGGSDCVADKAIYLGATSATTVYEVGCTNGLGQMLTLATPRTATSNVTVAPCLAISAVIKGATCSLTTEEANLAAVKTLGAKAQPPCQITKQRYVGADATSQYYEYACANGSGFMIQANAKGEYQRTVNCAQAQGVGGGCTLSDTKAAVANQNAAYSALVKAAGYNCDVNKFSTFPAKAGSTAEVIEFACANRPDGAIAIIANGKAAVLNCALAMPNGYGCGYTKPEASYPTLSKNLVTAGKESCTVSNARPVGANSKNAYVEVACADGLQGYIIAYPLGSDKPLEATVCSQAAALGGCSLPGNKKG